MRSDRLRLLDAVEQLDLVAQFSQRGKEAFLNDLVLQSAILHRLALLGEACNGLSSAFRQTHADIPWAQIVAFRNVIIHEYFGMDLELAWAILEQHVPALRQDLQRIRDSMSESG